MDVASLVALLDIGQSINIQRSDGRVHAAAITSVDEEKKFVAVEWFENGETKGKEIDLDQVYNLNKKRFVNEKVQSRRTMVAPGVRGGYLQAVENVSSVSKLSKGLPVSNSVNSVPPSGLPLPSYRLRPRQQAASENKPELLGKRPIAAQPTLPSLSAFPGFQQPRGTSNLPLQPPPSSSQHGVGEKAEKAQPPVVDPVGKEKVLTGRKSNCVREIEKMKKIREERRARHAEQLAQRREDYDTSHPQWEFLRMIKDFCSQLELRPLVGNEPVTTHKICVCVRKRPLNKKELARKEVDVITQPDKSSLLVHEPKVKVDLTKYLENHSFYFDYSFDENVNNNIVYRFTAQPLLKTIFQKGMATCFAYGQTGSGKTHTMGGTFIGKEQDATKGIYAQAAADVFRLNALPENASKKLDVSASFFEIYSGKVFDLLNRKSRLRVLEDSRHEVQIVGLREEPVSSLSDVLGLISAGNVCRTSGTTSANQHSSRSHAVFQIVLRRRQSRKVYGKFSLIDLAGNERGADTANSDRNTRMEGAEINRSLLALKECIRALGRKGAHLPFRGSKLTQVLKDSFVGDNTRTCMIAMISPGLSCCEHTLNTLRYADRVKELRSSSESAGEVMEELPVPAIDPTAPIETDLKYLHNMQEGNLDNSQELLTFQAYSNLVESEDQVMDDLHALMQEDRQLLEEQERVLENVNDVDHDIDACMQVLKKIYHQKLDRLSKFGEHLQDLEQRLQEEETASSAFAKISRGKPRAAV